MAFKDYFTNWSPKTAAAAAILGVAGLSYAVPKLPAYVLQGTQQVSYRLVGREPPAYDPLPPMSRSYDSVSDSDFTGSEEGPTITEENPYYNGYKGLAALVALAMGGVLVGRGAQGIFYKSAQNAQNRQATAGNPPAGAPPNPGPAQPNQNP